MQLHLCATVVLVASSAVLWCGGAPAPDAAVDQDAPLGGPPQGLVVFSHFVAPGAPEGIHSLSASFSSTEPVVCDPPVLATAGPCARIGQCDPGIARLSAAEIGPVRAFAAETEVLATSTTTQVSAPGLPPEGLYRVVLDGGSVIDAATTTAELPPRLTVTFPDRITRGAPLELRWTPTAAQHLEITVSSPGAMERVRCEVDASGGSVTVDGALLTAAVLPATGQVAFNATNESVLAGAGVPTLLIMARSDLRQSIPVD